MVWNLAFWARTGSRIDHFVIACICLYHGENWFVFMNATKLHHNEDSDIFSYCWWKHVVFIFSRRFNVAVFSVFLGNAEKVMIAPCHQLCPCGVPEFITYKLSSFLRPKGDCWDRKFLSIFVKYFTIVHDSLRHSLTFFDMPMTVQPGREGGALPHPIFSVGGEANRCSLLAAAPPSLARHIRYYIVSRWPRDPRRHFGPHFSFCKPPRHFCSSIPR